MILIAIGSNLPHPEVGQPREVCEAALNRLAQSGVRILRRSPWYGSAPVPASDQPWFVNGVAEVELEASGSPQSLLAALHAVEGELGRTRNRRNEARIVDLDLIDFEGRVSAPDASPLLPHPRLQERAFVLLPLRDLAPEWRHPVTGVAIQTLIDSLPKGQEIRLLD